MVGDRTDQLQIDTLQTFMQFLLQRLQADVMFSQRFMYGTMDDVA